MEACIPGESERDRASPSSSPSRGPLSDVISTMRADASSRSSTISTDGKSVEELEDVINRKTEALLQKDIMLQDAVNRSTENDKKVSV